MLTGSPKAGKQPPGLHPAGDARCREGFPCGPRSGAHPPAPQPSPHSPHPPLHPPRGPPISSSTLRLLLLSSHHVITPSQPQCHLLSVSWGVICLLPHVCGRSSPAMGTPGSSVGSVTITNVGMDAEGRPGCSRNTQLEEGEDGTGEGSWKRVRMGQERAAEWRGWDRHGGARELGQVGTGGAPRRPRGRGWHSGTPEAQGGERECRGLPWTPGGSKDKGSVQRQQARAA